MAIEIYSITSYTVNEKQNLVRFKLHVQYIHVLSSLHVPSIYVNLMQFRLHVQHIHVLSKLCVGSIFYS